MKFNLLPITIIGAFILFNGFGCTQRGSQNDQLASIDYDGTEKYVVFQDADVVDPSWSRSNTVIMHCIAEPDNLHPTNGTSGIRTEINQYTQMCLIRVDFKTLELAPALLEAMPVVQPDGRTYTCKLRKEPLWDDGSPVTSSDVIFTAMASKCPQVQNAMAKPYWDNLEAIIPDLSDPKVFTVVMKTPYMHNIAFWGDWPIMQENFFDPNQVLRFFTFKDFENPNATVLENPSLVSWAEKFNGADFGRNPAFLKGLGPYEVSNWDPGISVTLRRKSNHWTGNSTDIYETAYPDQIIFKVNKDPNSQILEFKSQVFDASTNISTHTLITLQQDSLFNHNYHSKFTDSFNYTYIGFNTRPDGIKHPKVFTDKNVRRAMALLTPVDELNRIINQGKNKRMIGPVSILKSDFDTSLKAIPYDPDRAKELLTAAGWKDTDGDGILDKEIDGHNTPFEFALTYMTNTPEWQDYATIIAEAWSKAGIKVNLNPLDFAVSAANAKNHDFDAMIAVWGQSALPEDFTQLWHSESWKSNGSNYPGFGDDASDALIDSIKITVDPEVRHAMVLRFQKMVYDEQPMVFLFSSMRRNIVHKRFGNVALYFERPGILVNNFKLLQSTDLSHP